MPQKRYIVRLTAQEREVCRETLRKLNGSSEKVRRAQVLLKADADGPAWTDERIADAFSCRTFVACGYPRNPDQRRATDSLRLAVEHAGILRAQVALARMRVGVSLQGGIAGTNGPARPRSSCSGE